MVTMKRKHKAQRQQDCHASKLPVTVKAPPDVTSPAAKCYETSPDARLSLTDRVDEASRESFPCSDPPGYYTSHV